jgi:periplasmic protein TonB
MNYYTLSVLFSLFLYQSASGKSDFGLCDSTRKSQADTTVFTIVEVAPEFPGGIESLKAFIKSNSTIPVATKAEKNTVWIHARLLIERDGKVSAVQVKRIGNIDEHNFEKYEREAQRIVSMMPRWKPGSQDGKPLRCYALIPILFKR